MPKVLQAALEYPYDGEVPQHSDSIFTSSGTAAVSISSRSWTNVAGSRSSVTAGVEAANAVDFRPRSCHLCFDPSHFILDCPLLGSKLLSWPRNVGRTSHTIPPLHGNRESLRVASRRKRCLRDPWDSPDSGNRDFRRSRLMLCYLRRPSRR
jgi:hypothetical protein